MDPGDRLEEAQVYAPPPPPRAGGDPMPNGLVCISRDSILDYSLANLVMQLPQLDIFDVVRNLKQASDVCTGGQARVYICRWRNPPDAPSAPAIPDGQLVAFKHMQLPLGGGNFVQCGDSEYAYNKAELLGRQALRLEMHLLDTLHSSGCGTRVVKPLALVCWPGAWVDKESRKNKWWQPTYGYLMPAYERGSVTSLLRDICHRALPESAAERYVGHATLASEYLALLTELRSMHTTPGVCLQLQDLTANNILVDDGDGGDGGPGRVRLLLSDPAMALPTSLLRRERPPPGSILGTWLWGSMRARHGLFDATADLYSLSFIFAEMWLVSEGAPTPVSELIFQNGLNGNKAQAVEFVRLLVAYVLQSSLLGDGIRPRVKRLLPVSWLGAWALLLGLRDHRSEAEMRSGLPCLRPSEEEMLEVAGLWARVSSAAQDLPEGLTLEQATSEACRPLVTDMCALYGRLVQLTRLDNKTEADIKWVATQFLTQSHPLVLAMKAQGAPEVGPPKPQDRQPLSWAQVVMMAQVECGHATDMKQMLKVLHGQRQEMEQGRQFQRLWQWYCQDGRHGPLEKLAEQLQQAAVAVGFPPAPTTAARNEPGAPAGQAAEPQSKEDGAVEEAADHIERLRREQLPGQRTGSDSPVLPPAFVLVQEVQAASRAAQCGIPQRAGQAVTGLKGGRGAQQPGAERSRHFAAAAHVLGDEDMLAAAVVDAVAMADEAEPVGAGPSAQPHMGPGTGGQQQTQMAVQALNTSPLVSPVGQPLAAGHAQALGGSSDAGAPTLAATASAAAAALPASPAAAYRQAAGAATQDEFTPRSGVRSAQRRPHTAVRSAQAARSGAAPGTSATPLAAAEPSSGYAPRSSKRLCMDISTVSAATGPLVVCSGQADGSGATGGCGQAMAGGPADIYPRLNSSGEPVEGAEAWLARIRPRLEASMLEAVVPGERQLDAFKGRITTLDLAVQLLELWGSSQLKSTSVAGVVYNHMSKNVWNKAVWARVGLQPEGRIKGWDRSTHHQRLLHCMRAEVAAAVQQRVAAMMSS